VFVNQTVVDDGKGRVTGLGQTAGRAAAQAMAFL